MRPARFERGQERLVDARLGVHEPTGGMEARPVDRVLHGRAVMQDPAEHADERGA